MDKEQLALAQALVKKLTPRWTKYIKGKPHPKQQLFLCLDHVEELFFGGAAGPGKSWAMLAAALQYVDCPDYAALLVRRNFPDLAQPGGLIDLSHEWLDNTDAKWNEGLKRWSFPPYGSTLHFGHMDDKDSFKRYRGGEYQFIGIDEMTDFEERTAMFLHSRLRRRANSTVPIRFRGASNPGGTGHNWVKARFVDTQAEGRAFIPATMDDNPFIDRVAYLRQLMNLDPVTRERLIRGDWSVIDGGNLFNRSWWRTFLDVPPVLVGGRIRGWDLAATAGSYSKETAGVRMSKTYQGLYVIEDVIRGKWFPGDRDSVIKQSAELDGPWVKVVVEEEPGSGGKAQNAALIRMLAGYRVESIKATGNKFVRAGALASQVQAGNVALVRGPWNANFIEQLHAADPENDKLLIDQMDAASLAFNSLVGLNLWPEAVETPDKKNLSEDEQDALAQEEERKTRDGGLYEDIMDGKDWEGALN